MEEEPLKCKRHVPSARVPALCYNCGERIDPVANMYSSEPDTEVRIGEPEDESPNNVSDYWS